MPHVSGIMSSLVVNVLWIFKIRISNNIIKGEHKIFYKICVPITIWILWSISKLPISVILNNKDLFSNKHGDNLRSSFCVLHYEFYSYCSYTIDISATDHSLKRSTSFLSSQSVSDLRIGVTSFCKAFPWHFIVDKKLDLVQLGAGYMRLFGRCLKSLGKFCSISQTFR